MATITDKTIQSYIRESKKDTSKKYRHFPIGSNLWLRVHTKTGSAHWLFRVAVPDTTESKRYKMTYTTIGAYPMVTMLEAKGETTRLNLQVKSGINPVDAKQNPNIPDITLKQVWDKWLGIANIKPITRLKLQGMYNNHISKLTNKPILNITDKLAWDIIIQPIIDNDNKRQAKIVLDKLKQLARYAYQTHLIDKNLFDRLDIPSEFKVRKVRERTLSIDELPVFLSSLEKAYADNQIDIRYHHFIKLVLLLGTRKAELAMLKWEHYNQGKQTILLTNTKSGDDLLIKLPSQAVKLFEELREPQISEYIFYGLKENTHMSLRSILYYLGHVTKLAKIDDLTIHDLRRTFSSRLSGLKFRLELIEKATNHKIQGTAKYYQHDDMLEERHEMLRTWADYLDGLIGKE